MHGKEQKHPTKPEKKLGPERGEKGGERRGERAEDQAGSSSSTKGRIPPGTCASEQLLQWPPVSLEVLTKPNPAKPRMCSPKALRGLYVL